MSKIQLDVKFDRNVLFDLGPRFFLTQKLFSNQKFSKTGRILTSIVILISNFNRSFILEGSFPHRILETGQKYHGTNGLVRDEFSSPFHWETQSQMETFYIMDPIEIPGKNLENSKH